MAVKVTPVKGRVVTNGVTDLVDTVPVVTLPRDIVVVLYHTVVVNLVLPVGSIVRVQKLPVDKPARLCGCKVVKLERLIDSMLASKSVASLDVDDYDFWLFSGGWEDSVVSGPHFIPEIHLFHGE